MGILLCEQNFRNVWIRNESVRAEIGQILHADTHPHTLTHTHTHTTAAKLVVRIMHHWFAIYLPAVAIQRRITYSRKHWQLIKLMIIIVTIKMNDMKTLK